jgi:hypothetical protein
MEMRDGYRGPPGKLGPAPKGGASGADPRARFYLSAVTDRRVAWRRGVHGARNFSGTAGQALDEILAETRAQPCVIFWEGGPFE